MVPGEKEAAGAAVTLGIFALNKIIALAIKYSQETGEIPTYAQLEERNLLTGLKIDRLMKEE
jgi:hypothetical protein